MDSIVLDLRTGSRLVTDITGEAQRFVADRADGLLSVFVPHATAGVALMETGSGSEPDLEDALERLLPVADVYRHRHGSPGHGRDHVLPAFIGPSLVVPVLGGRLALGTWQGIFLCEFDGPRTRELWLTPIKEAT